MKKDTYMTVQDIFDYVEKYDIPRDTPIGIALCASEDGDVCTGIIVDTSDEDCDWNEDDFDYVRDETHGEHCYFKGRNPLKDVYSNKMLMLTDGRHCEY